MSMGDVRTSERAALKHALRTSAIRSRIEDRVLGYPPIPKPEALTGAVMAEPASSTAVGALFAKLLPAGIGAILMVAVDMPKDKRELFWRVFVAFAASYLFGDVVFDMLHSFPLFSFLSAGKRAHTAAVDGLVGALGWFVLGGVAMYLRRFRADPVQAVKDAKAAQ